jgi:hypothetical protein
MKKILFWCLACVVFILFCSCVSFSKEFSASSPIDLSQGYIFGKFWRTEQWPNAYLALNIQNVENGKKYNILFSEINQASVFQIAPGRYKIVKCIALWSGKTKAGEFEFSTSNNGLNNVFTIEPGTLLYIGDFLGSIRNTTSSAYGSRSQLRFSINAILDNYSSILEEIQLRSMHDMTVLAARNLLIE